MEEIPTSTALIEAALGPTHAIVTAERIGAGHGVFSQVFRVSISPPLDGTDTVVVKLPDTGANGDAARVAGAYRREALAYQQLLPVEGVGSPTCHRVAFTEFGEALVLADVGRHRAVDQLEGLGAADLDAVIDTLGRLHRRGDPNIGEVRINTVATLDPQGLRAGLDALGARWSSVIDDEMAAGFATLVEHQQALATSLAAAGPDVLCHGDPRADNLVFADHSDGPSDPILFDWQQIARQPGVADLAWLVATSTETAEREHRRILDRYRNAVDRVVSDEAYRLGFALPGLAVLFLAQRITEEDRLTALVSTSLRRIGRTIVELELPTLARRLGASG